MGTGTYPGFMGDLDSRPEFGFGELGEYADPLPGNVRYRHWP